MPKTFSIKISDTLGSVSAEETTGARIDAIVTLAHGAGAGMNHPFMGALADALAAEGIATVRFNFVYMEQKKKRPDVPPVAHKTIEAVVHHVQKQFPDVPFFMSGKSFGGRMSSQYVAGHHPEFLTGLIFFGFPLHPAGNPDTDRADHLKNVKAPMLFLQGTRDTLAEWDLIEAVTKGLPLARLVKFEGADHSFKAGKQNLIPVLAQAVREWITTLK